MAEDLVDVTSEAVGAAQSERPEGRTVGEGHALLGVGGEEARQHAVEDGLDVAPSLLETGQDPLEHPRALGSQLVEMSRGCQLGLLGDVGLDGDEVREAPRRVEQRRHGKIVPERRSVLAVVAEGHPGGPAPEQRVAQLVGGGHVGLGVLAAA